MEYHHRLLTPSLSGDLTEQRMDFRELSLEISAQDGAAPEPADAGKSALLRSLQRTMLDQFAAISQGR